MSPEHQGSSPIDPTEAHELEEEIYKERLLISDLKTQLGTHEVRLNELLATAASLGVAIPPATDYLDPANWNYSIEWPRTILSLSAMDRVKNFIDEHPMKQSDFKDRAGISLRTLSALITTGRASIDTWRSVAKAMNISFEDLLKP
jgi:hypothetical protein